MRVVLKTGQRLESYLLEKNTVNNTKNKTTESVNIIYKNKDKVIIYNSGSKIRG